MTWLLSVAAMAQRTIEICQRTMQETREDEYRGIRLRVLSGNGEEISPKELGKSIAGPLFGRCRITKSEMMSHRLRDTSRWCGLLQKEFHARR